MTERARPFESLAREIVDREIATRTAPEEVGRAIEATFRRLEQVMSTMVGEVGFRALMVRALHLTRQHAPKETVLPSELAVSFPSEGWQAAVNQTGPSEAAGCAAQLLSNVLELLASFIGDDLTFRLVRRTWKESGSAGSGPRENGST